MNTTHRPHRPAQTSATRLFRAAVFSGLIATTTLLAACRDETLTGYGAADKVWVLSTLDNTPFETRTTLSFPETGKLAGQAPCNSYHGAQKAPYPWFQTEALVTTRMTCPDQSSEDIYFQSLAKMTEAEVAGDTLILRNEAGQEMVFRAAD